MPLQTDSMHSIQSCSFKSTSNFSCINTGLCSDHAKYVYWVFIYTI